MLKLHHEKNIGTLGSNLSWVLRSVPASSLSSKMTRILRKILLVSLFLTILIHGIGILIPETGFDALWYHLPIVRDMAVSHQIRIVPSIPQSNQPRLGEIIFLPWFLMFSTTGVKICTFLLTLLLLFLTYQLSRRYLDELEALLIVLLVASFHTVAWQATSAYVDILRTCFELAALLAVMHKKVWLMGLCLGLALLTKSVALLFLPPFILFLITKRGIRKASGVLILSVSLFLPSQIQGIMGQGILPAWEIFSSHADHLILRNGHLLGWVILGLSKLLVLPIELSFHAESYTTPVFLFAFPFILAEGQWLWRVYRAEVVFLLASLSTWVFVVPVSVRYDLSAIILALIVCFMAALRFANRYSVVKTLLVFLAGLNIVFNLSIRLGVILRSAPFLLGQETESQYLNRFNQGILKGPLEEWYRVQ